MKEFIVSTSKKIFGEIPNYELNDKMPTGEKLKAVMYKIKESIKRVFSRVKTVHLIIFAAILLAGGFGVYVYQRPGPSNQMNTTIVKATGAYAYKNTTNLFHMQFKEDPTDTKGIVFSNTLGNISFYTPADQSFGKINSNNPPVADGSTLTYPEIFPQIDLRYTISSSRLLEEFIVKDAATASQVSRIEQRAQTKSTYVEGDDGSITFYQKNKEVFTLPHPLMYETGNRDNSSEGIIYEIKYDQGELIITKVITDEGKAWLADPKRVYPIAIDLVIDNADTLTALDAAIDNADTSSNWTSSDATNTAVSQETTIKQEGAGSVKVQTTAGGAPVNVDLMEYSSNGTAQAAFVTNSATANGTGGTITTSGGYTIHTFTSSGTFTSIPGVSSVKALVVAGGGGGGSTMGGGGGGGGVLYNGAYAVSPGAIAVSVGGGGAGGPAGSREVAGSNGQNSVFGTMTAIGGGGGASNFDYDLHPAGNGGSGGGASGGAYIGGPAGYGGVQGSGTSGQGYGGAGSIGTWYPGGGGGAGHAGYSNPGNGGIGYLSSINGTSLYYGGGGGGAGYSNIAGNGGLGGGGGGAPKVSGGGLGGGSALNSGSDGTVGVLASATNVPGGNAGANTGGGGGGGSHYNTNNKGGNGGSGVVIISYVPPTNLQSYTEATIKTQGTYAIKGVANQTTSLNKTLTRTIGTPLNLSGSNSATFDLRASRTGSNIKVGLHDSGGTTTEVTPNITSANTFQSVTLDLSGVTNANKDAIDQIIITIVNADAGNTFYLDNMVAAVSSSLNDTVTRTTAATDLSGVANITYWVRSTVAGSYATFGFGEIAATEQTNTITINQANTWEQKTWDISGIAAASRNAVTKFAFTFTTDTSGASLYFDDIRSQDPSGIWTSSDATATTVSQETTIKQEGAGSVKVQTTAEASTTLDLMEYSSDGTAQAGYITNGAGISATGGTITNSDGYTIHKFTSSGTFTPNGSGTVDYLVVAGGGGGGTNSQSGGGGGGGAGGMRTGTLSIGSGNKTVTVGNGGTSSSNGGNSVFDSIASIGGGAGADGVATTGEAGVGGGSGGGGGFAYSASNAYSNGGGGTAGQGSNGGRGLGNNADGNVAHAGGGGGGKGAAGADATNTSGGNGGVGEASSISGSSVYYAGGGGGGKRNTGSYGTGGNGGGGNGGLNAMGSAGTENTGGGGGGSGAYPSQYAGATGGSGIVIVRYLTPPYLQSYTEPTIKTQGTYAIKGVANQTTSLNKTLTRTIGTPLNLSGSNSATFDLRASRTGSNIKVGIHDSGGTTTEVTPNITSVNTYQSVTIDLSGVTNANKDAIDKIIITIVNADATNTFYLDNMVAAVSSSLNDTVTRTTTATDLSTAANLTYWVRSSVAGSYATFGFGEIAATEQTNTITINQANTWEQKSWNIESISAASRNAVTKFAFTFTGDTSGASFYFDDIQTNALFAPTLGTATGLSDTSIRWNFTDNSGEETGFKIYDADSNLLVTCTSANLTYCDETGLSLNTQYTRKIGAYNASFTSIASGTVSGYTLAAVPNAPVVSSRAATTININPDPATNPAATQMAIYKETGTTCDGTGGSYIAANGSDNGATAVWQTDAQWATVTVTGLNSEQQYAFCVKARNADNAETSFGSTGLFNAAFVPISGDFVVTANTSFTSGNRYVDGADSNRYVIGVDSGSGTTNSGVLEVRSGILTVNTNETVVAGSFTLTGGSIAIANGGVLKVGAAVWAIDADGDGYTADTKLYVGAQPTNGVRKNLVTTLDTADCGDSTYATNNVCCTVATRYRDADGDTYGNPSVSISACTTAGYVDNNTDCNDASASLYRSVAGYLDSDGDGYGAGAYTTCVGASGSYVASGADCYDANASAKPGSTTCSATNRGDGSFDYNCSGGSTLCGAQYYNHGVSCIKYWKPNVGCPCAGNYEDVITSAITTCGASGVQKGGAYGEATDCQAQDSYNFPGAGGTQACQ